MSASRAIKNAGCPHRKFGMMVCVCAFRDDDECSGLLYSGGVYIIVYLFTGQQEILSVESQASNSDSQVDFATVFESYSGKIPALAASYSVSGRRTVGVSIGGRCVCCGLCGVSPFFAQNRDNQSDTRWYRLCSILCQKDVYLISNAHLSG